MLLKRPLAQDIQLGSPFLVHISPRRGWGLGTRLLPPPPPPPHTHTHTHAYLSLLGSLPFSFLSTLSLLSPFLLSPFLPPSISSHIQLPVKYTYSSSPLSPSFYFCLCPLCSHVPSTPFTISFSALSLPSLTLSLLSPQHLATTRCS